MKKVSIIAMFLFIITLPFFSVSCDKKDNIDMLDANSTCINETLETESDTGNSPIEYMSSASYTYYTFEEACATATDVVIAEFEGFRPYNGNYNITEYSFVVKDILLGDAGDELKVYTDSQNYVYKDELLGVYDPSEVYPLVDRDYILILEHRASVYDNTDRYAFICSMLIDLTSPADSTMYNEPIAKHTNIFDFGNATQESVIEYVSELVKHNTPSVQLEKSPSLDTVIKSSENVLSIKVNECDRTSSNVFYDVGYYYCTVTEIFKGDLKVGSEIYICLNNKDVEGTDEIIVAFNNENTKYYKLSTKNSVMSVEDKNAIIEALSQYEE